MQTPKYNVMEYAHISEINWRENLKTMNEFKPEYTFYSDLSIAEWCQIFAKGDENAIEETYTEFIMQFGDNYKALTELILVLNHKLWSFHQKVDSNYLNCDEKTRYQLEQLYTRLYNRAETYFFKRYERNQQAQQYYYRVTD